ncbi:DUF1345 domain-containing protein [Tessaracoccus palaemonis]|uniref:DUF1345 domain-containing protein n=1 Tax=Tessaracoccus palaemonis TaxID=2829499 RepID=A0ABX8SGW1_9ACTN|nr:DUF1345 domain-containing protein [Tessaracoccus palaemonis]QXT62633.1 DUF1345 domain-containing protein [Tessaracoccus palaemonis]
MQASRAVHRTTRLVICAAVGVAVGLLVAAFASPHLAASAGWTGGVLLYCVWTWAKLWRLDARQTAANARQEDPGRGPTDLVLVLASLASVGGIGFVLLAGQAADDASAALGATTVAASWVLVHTVYGVRYADLYFSAPSPPIDFGDEAPTYSDFAYLSFCLGMTYQVSDTTLRTGQLRRAVLAHTLLSYFLGAVVLACTINLVSGLATH